MGENIDAYLMCPIGSLLRCMRIAFTWTAVITSLAFARLQHKESRK
jgi:hypothetical protein